MIIIVRYILTLIRNSLIFFSSTSICMNSTTQNSSNTQHLNAIYTNRLSSTIISTTNSSEKRNIKELEINIQVNGK